MTPCIFRGRFESTLNAVQTSSEKFGLNFNINKKKVMIMPKQSPDEPSISITASNSKIEKVQHFDYLGSWITSDARCKKEIRQRINLAKSSFNSVKNIFRDCKLQTSKNKNFEMFQVVGFYVWLAVKPEHVQQRLGKT